MKRRDVRERGSAFNRRGTIGAALAEVIAAVRARWILVSFNDEGYLSPADVEGMLAARGEVTRVAIPYRRYVGHRIGIYNPDGVKVGTPGPARNRELLFLVDAGGTGVHLDRSHGARAARAMAPR